MHSGLENLTIREDMVINPTSEGFLKRMFSQRAGIMVCSGPSELDGVEVLRILANHSIRLSIGHFFSPALRLEKPPDDEPGLTSADINRLSAAFMASKPDYKFFERRINEQVFSEIVRAAVSEGVLAIGYMPAASSFVALSKLLDVAGNRTLLASVLNGIFAVNYIHIICPYCKIELPPAEIPTDLIITGELDGACLKQFRGKGCERCGNGGYIGYEILCECLDITSLREAIIQGATRSTLKRMGKSAGTTTLLDSTWAFFRAGITTLDEVRRIAAATK